MPLINDIRLMVQSSRLFSVWWYNHCDCAPSDGTIIKTILSLIVQLSKLSSVWWYNYPDCHPLLFATFHPVMSYGVDTSPGGRGGLSRVYFINFLNFKIFFTILKLYYFFNYFYFLIHRPKIAQRNTRSTQSHNCTHIHTHTHILTHTLTHTLTHAYSHTDSMFLLQRPSLTICYNR
jgi:hypothetical protein